MRKGLLTALMLMGIIGSVSAQHDDLYFVPKKKKVEKESAQIVKAEPEKSTADKALSVTAVPAKGLQMDEDTYNRRGSYLTEQGDAVSEFAMNDEGFVLITEEGDTMWMNTDTLKLTRVDDGEGWVNGFEGSDSDYEYAMRIIRFRNPRYAIPVSSPLYWDVVYGGALWPTWDWNIYDDGMYAYVFPTSSNWQYWDYMMSYPFGWSPWGGHWHHHWGYHYGHHWGMGPYWDGWSFYGHVWYDPWFNPYFHGYHPGWHHGHHAFYPGFGVGKPGWGGVTPGSRPRENDRHAAVASTRRGTQDNNAVNRGGTTTTRRGTSITRTGEGSSRSSSVRVVTGRTGSSSERSSSAVRSSSRGGNDEVLRRGSGSSSAVSRGSATTGTSSRSSYTRQSSSRSSSGSSYNRPSSTRSSSSSSISRSSSSSSSRSSSYSSGSSRSSSYSGSSSYSSGSSYSSSSRSSSYSGGGSSYSGGGSRSGSSSSGSSRGGGGGSRR